MKTIKAPFVRVLFLLSGPFTLSVLAACTATTSGSGTGDGTPAGPTGTSTSTGPGGPTSTGTTTAPPPPPPPAKAHLRFANAGYQTGAVDFCIRKQGATSWDGPLLHGIGATDGADQGMMTNAFDRDAGSYDVAVVTSAATTCDKTVVASKTPVTLAGGGGAIVILRGNGGVIGAEALAVATIPDESTAPAAGKARVRFFHASANWESGQASVYLGAQPTFTGVAFGQLAKASSVGTPSAAGYVDIAPTSPDITVKGLSDFDGPQDVAGMWTPKAGDRTTLLFVGAAGSGFYPPTVLACPDAIVSATAGAPMAGCQ